MVRVFWVDSIGVGFNKRVTEFVKIEYVFVLSFFVTVTMLGWLLWVCHYGLDTTDEGFYLTWIANPFNYGISATQFGFIYHPLFLVSFGNVVTVRQINLLITFGLAFALCHVYLKFFFRELLLSNFRRLVISAALASTALLLFEFWLPTPNYNTLNLQGLLLAAAGAVLIDKLFTRVSLIGSVLVGLGGWLTFMAKPTSAVALAFFLLLYLLAAGKFGLRILLISFATSLALLLLSALCIDGSLIRFVDRLKGGAEVASTLGGGHTFLEMLRLGEVLIEPRTRHILGGGAAGVAILGVMAMSNIRLLNIAASLGVVACLALSVLLIYRGEGVGLDISFYSGLWISIIICSCVLLNIAKHGWRGPLKIVRGEWFLALFFLLLPYAFAVGTNNSYWTIGAHAGIFWVLAGLIFLCPSLQHTNTAMTTLQISIIAQLITIVLVGNAIVRPYRQPAPLPTNDMPVSIGAAGTTLLLSKSQGTYLTSAQSALNESGFTHGTPMIDLTGRSPGVLYAMGADSVGSAWFPGGYPGSNSLATEMLATVSCDKLGAAWLLVEYLGWQSLSVDVLHAFGANVATDFEVVGTLAPPYEPGASVQGAVQLILRPSRLAHTAVAACLAHRRALAALPAETVQTAN
jgi:hypothetical protein